MGSPTFAEIEELRLLIKKELGDQVHVVRQFGGGHLTLVIKKYGPRKRPNHLPDPLFVSRATYIYSHDDYLGWKKENGFG